MLKKIIVMSIVKKNVKKKFLEFLFLELGKMGS